MTITTEMSFRSRYLSLLFLAAAGLFFLLPSEAHAGRWQMTGCTAANSTTATTSTGAPDGTLNNGYAYTNCTATSSVNVNGSPLTDYWAKITQGSGTLTAGATNAMTWGVGFNSITNLVNNATMYVKLASSTTSTQACVWINYTSVLNGSHLERSCLNGNGTFVNSTLLNSPTNGTTGLGSNSSGLLSVSAGTLSATNGAAVNINATNLAKVFPPSGFSTSNGEWVNSISIGLRCASSCAGSSGAMAIRNFTFSMYEATNPTATFKTPGTTNYWLDSIKKCEVIASTVCNNGTTYVNVGILQADVTDIISGVTGSGIKGAVATNSAYNYSSSSYDTGKAVPISSASPGTWTTATWLSSDANTFLSSSNCATSTTIAQNQCLSSYTDLAINLSPISSTYFQLNGLNSIDYCTWDYDYTNSLYNAGLSGCATKTFSLDNYPPVTTWSGDTGKTASNGLALKYKSTSVSLQGSGNDRTSGIDQATWQRAACNSGTYAIGAYSNLAGTQDPTDVAANTSRSYSTTSSLSGLVDGDTYSYRLESSDIAKPYLGSTSGVTKSYSNAESGAPAAAIAESGCFAVDSTAPAATLNRSSCTAANSLGWNNTNVVCSITAVSDATSGVRSVRYTTDGGINYTNSGALASGTSQFTVSPEGDYTGKVRAEVQDNSQKADGTYNTTTTPAIDIKIDKTAPSAMPTITSSPAASVLSSSATFNFSDSAESATGRYFQCQFDGGSWATAAASISPYATSACGTSNSDTGSVSFASLPVGYHTLSIRRTDRADNPGPGVTYTWCADPTDSDSDGVGNMCDDTVNATPGAAPSCSDSAASSRPGNRDCASSLTVYTPKPQSSSGSAINTTWNLTGQGASLARTDNSGNCSPPAGTVTTITNCTLSSPLQLSLNSGTSYFTLGSNATTLLSNQSNDSAARAGRVLTLDYRQPVSWADESGDYSRVVTYTITTSP